jgi:hypothetical protein
MKTSVLPWILILALFGCNDKSSVVNQPQEVGSLEVSWSVNGQTASEGCPTGGSVSIVSTQQPAGIGQVSTSTSCSAGMITIANLAVGQWTFQATLTDGVRNSVIGDLAVDIVENQTASIAGVDFTLAFGSVNFPWLVNGQAASIGCPAGGSVTVISIHQPAGAGQVSATTDCTDGLITLSNLVPGDWIFQATLTDGQKSDVQGGIAVTVIANTTADISAIDFTF